MNTIECITCTEKNNIKYKHCYQCGNELPKIEEEILNGFLSFLYFILDILKKISIALLNNLYLIFLIISISCFIFYGIVNDDPDYFKGWKEKKSVLEVIKNLSLIIFSAGIFTSSLKYLQYIKVFEKEFDRILNSEKFSSKIKESVESITFSKEFLHKQNNLEKIWQKVTLVMYEKQFPDLYHQLKNELQNELFNHNNISFYYKNFKIEYFITRIPETDNLKIEEQTTYTLVRPNNKLFDWDFKVAIDSDDSDNKRYPEIEMEFLNSTKCIFNKTDDVEVIEQKDLVIKKIKKKLHGNKNYLIKRKIIMVQNLHKDREYSFGSDRIIDDLDITIQFSEDLNVIFSESWKVKFIKKETKDNNIKSYIYRGLLLPGEKFKLFFLKVD